MQRLPSYHRTESTRQRTPVSTCLRLSVRKCGARCLFDCVRLGEMAIAPSPFLLLRASGTSFAPRANRSDPNSGCLVVFGAPGLQPWAMGRYHEGPAQSCPKGAYSSDRGLHQPERSRAHGFQPRTPLTVHMRLSTSGVSLSKPPQPTSDAKGAGVPERKIGSEALEASVKLRKSSIECLSAASFEAARSEQLRVPAEGPLKRRDSSSCKSTVNPLPGLGFSLTETHFS